MSLLLLLVAQAAPFDPQARLPGTTRQRCEAARDGELVVCGRREDLYRIDPRVLATLPPPEREEGANSVDRRALFADTCKVGPQGCQKPFTIPVIGTGEGTALGVVIALVGGKPVRDVLGVKSDYESFEEAEKR